MLASCAIEDVPCILEINRHKDSVHSLCPKVGTCINNQIVGLQELYTVERYIVLAGTCLSLNLVIMTPVASACATNNCAVRAPTSGTHTVLKCGSFMAKKTSAGAGTRWYSQPPSRTNVTGHPRPKRHHAPPPAIKPKVSKNLQAAAKPVTSPLSGPRASFAGGPERYGGLLEHRRLYRTADRTTSLIVPQQPQQGPPDLHSTPGSYLATREAQF